MNNFVQYKASPGIVDQYKSRQVQLCFVVYLLLSFTISVALSCTHIWFYHASKRTFLNSVNAPGISRGSKKP